MHDIVWPEAERDIDPDGRVRAAAARDDELMHPPVSCRALEATSRRGARVMNPRRQPPPVIPDGLCIPCFAELIACGRYTLGDPSPEPATP